RFSQGHLRIRRLGRVCGPGREKPIGCILITRRARVGFFRALARGLDPPKPSWVMRAFMVPPRSRELLREYRTSWLVHAIASSLGPGTEIIVDRFGAAPDFKGPGNSSSGSPARSGRWDSIRDLFRFNLHLT